MSKAASKTTYLEVTYDEKILPRTTYPSLLANYLKNKFFQDATSVLDVGSGRGEFLEAFNMLGLEARGVDLSPSIKDLAKRFEVSQCDFENEVLPYADATFDSLFSKSVVEHLHCPEKLVDECYRILKPGGKAVFMCPSWIHTYWGPFYIDHTHVTPFTLPSLIQLLKLSGFEVVYGDHFVQLPVVWKYPFLRIISDFIALFPIPYSPLYNVRMPSFLNKYIRFSKEKMLLVVGEKK